MGLGHSREAQVLRLGDENAFLGGLTKRPTELDETSRASAKIRENSVAGLTLDIFGLSDLSSACVSSGLKFRGLSCPLQGLKLYFDLI